jgi:hypothetical protein
MDDPVIGSTVRQTNAKALNLAIIHGKEPPIKLDSADKKITRERGE